MKFHFNVERGLQWLVEWVTIAHVEKVSFRTHCVQGDLAYAVLHELTELQGLDGSTPLRTHVSSGDRDVLVTLVGPGRRSGFMCLESRTGSETTLSQTWWAGIRGRVFLFAYTSFSANVIRSNVKKFISQGVGYDGFLWFYVDERNPQTLVFQRWFIRELIRTARARDRVDLQTKQDIERLYEMVISGKKVSDEIDTKDFAYQLSLLCLVKQKDSIHII